MPRSRAIRFFCVVLLWLGTAAGVNAQILQVSHLAGSATAEVGERVMREAFRRIGLTMQLHDVPLPRGLPMADSGELDADLIRPKSIDGRFPHLIRLSVPVVMLDFAAYGRTANIRSMGRDEMRRLAFGVPRGMLSAQKLVEGLNATEGPTLAALFEMLSVGRFDIAVLPYAEAEVVIRQTKGPAVYIWPQYWGSEPLYFVLNRKHQALVAPLEQALAQMEGEGLIRKYHAEMLKAKGISALKN